MQSVIAHIGTLRRVKVEAMNGVQENVKFKLPPEVTGKVDLRTARVQ